MKSSNAVFAALIAVLVCVLASPAWANPDQLKIYKKVYPGTHPKCIDCHADKTPKKEEGKHELNDYGKKVKALKEHPDEAIYKQAGPFAS